MAAEYDFSGGERGKFYNPDAEFHFPIHLEPDVNEFMSKLARERNVDIEALVNDWLRSNIKVFQGVDT
ncbi:MAG: hypothetical protein NVS2B14_11340 [Chamaesiphon sp.]